MKESDFVVAEEYKLTSERKEWGWHFLEISDCQHSDARIQISTSSWEKVSRGRKFLMPRLMEDIKPEIYLKYEFENREKFKWNCFTWKYRTIRVLMQAKKNGFFWMFFSGCSVFDGDLDERYRTCKGWDLKFSLSVDGNINSNFFKIWTLRNQLHDSTKKIVYCIDPGERKKVSDSHLGGRNHTCCFWGLWVSLSSQVKMTQHFSECPIVGIMIEWSKVLVFSIEPFSNTLGFWFGIWWKKVGLTLFERTFLISRKNHYKHQFHKFHDYHDSNASQNFCTLPLKQFSTSGKQTTETCIRDIHLYFWRKVSSKKKIS